MNRLKTTALILILSFSLSALPVMGQDSQYQEEEQTETNNRGAFWGALIGGLLGTFFGDNNQDQAINAAIGAAIGAGAGLLLDKKIELSQDDNQGQPTESKSERAERMIREVRTTNEQLRQDLISYQQQFDWLAKSQGNANLPSLRKPKQILQQHQANAEQTLAILTNELKGLQQLYRKYERKGNFTESLQWQVRIAKMEQEKYELESNIEELTIIKSRL